VAYEISTFLNIAQTPYFPQSVYHHITLRSRSDNFTAQSIHYNRHSSTISPQEKCVYLWSPEASSLKACNTAGW